MSTRLKVIIAGGGIAGLTLANCLEKANIDYVLLERRQTFTPQVGASIGIFSNGCRILDQLGCLKEWEDSVIPIVSEYRHDKHGKDLMPANGRPQLTESRSGYFIAFGDRTDVLSILVNNLKDKSKLLSNKNLTDIRQTSTGVVAICEDGTSYTGDILVGADGVNSKARSEMWRLADEEDPELVKADKEAMTADYQCLYGISSDSAGLPSGSVHHTYDRGKSLFIIVGKDKKSYYFLFKKLDKVFRPPNIPRYGQADKDKFVLEHESMKLSENMVMKDLYKTHLSSTLVALETASYKLWTRGRIACLGDSAHKMTPNAGQGGNAAIESAAALANAIKKLADTTSSEQKHPDLDKVIECLESYQKEREFRAAAAIKASTFVTNFQALASWGHVLLANYGLALFDVVLQDLAADMAIGAVKIDYLPPPERSLHGTMPFNPEQGDGKKESKMRRLLLALPFLALVAVGLNFMDPTPVMPALNKILENGKIAMAAIDIPIMRSFFGVSWWDEGWVPVNVFFTPSIFGYDPISRIQSSSFLIDLAVIISIWSIESVRRNNFLTPAQIPGVFTMLAQLRGIGIIAPIYYFLHWILTPIENFKCTDMRLTWLKNTYAILPSLFLTYYIPLLGAFFWPDMYQRQGWLFVWQIYPVWYFLAQTFISRFFKDTMEEDKLHDTKRDVPVLRYTVGVPSFFSAVTWISKIYTTSIPFVQVFLPSSSTQESTDFVLFTRQFFQWDELLLFASTYLWLGYFMSDAKHAGMIIDSWLKIILLAGISTICLGPGATVGGLWLWREWIVTEKRHKGAITKESVARDMLK